MMKRAGDEAGGTDAGGLRIGTVAGLTGLSPDTIRAWERRHRVIDPIRSDGGFRLYRDSDVERLQLVKALSDCGQPLALVAGLSNDALRRRLADLAGLGEGVGEPDARVGAARLPLRVALLAPRLAEQVRAHPAGWTDLEVTCSAPDVPGLAASVPTGDVDVVVADLPALGSSALAGVESVRRSTRASQILVLYDFARRSTLAQLARSPGVRLLRGPASLADVRRRILDGATIAEATRRWAELPEPPAGEAPAPLFDEAQLARLRELPSSVECECPAHLSGLVASLSAFETYSRSCESRDEADAALHHRLAAETARARAILERMLMRVCEHDGIRV